jgi:N utilization substance protein A
MRSQLPVNQELLHLIDQISREKGIDKSVLVDAIQSAVLSAVRKRSGMSDALRARLDEQTGNITLVASKTVVSDEEIDIDNSQINLADAQHQDPNVALGDTIDVLYEIGDFGRIAAQTAKQVIIQKVREAERDMVFQEFKDRQGDLVNGVVSRIEREGNIIVDLGKTEALLPRREQSFRETFRRGDRIRAYIIEVKNSTSGHQVFLSRTHPGFLICLFELEVPEIYEGIVEIKEAVRDSSGRAKIAVMSHDSDVDPVGACVGMKGMRVQAVVQELRGEKIDIIQWTEDREQFVRNALSPAKVSRVQVNEDDNTMVVIVPNDQLSLAIGKRGQNVRLAAKLTHWKIDIKSESEADVDGERLEALRRAEMMFQPLRKAVDAEDSPAASIIPASAVNSDHEALSTSSADESQPPPASEAQDIATTLPADNSDEPHQAPDISEADDDTASGKII